MCQDNGSYEFKDALPGHHYPKVRVRRSTSHAVREIFQIPWHSKSAVAWGTIVPITINPNSDPTVAAAPPPLSQGRVGGRSEGVQGN